LLLWFLSKEIKITMYIQRINQEKMRQIWN
jgi:hypothetical protein